MTVAWAHLHLPKFRSGDPDCISLKVPGRVIEYTSCAVIRGAEFKVSEAGRQRCIRQGVRNVHAWVVGDLVASGPYLTGLDCPRGFRRALYDPWKGSSFVDGETFEPVLSADLVLMSGKNVYHKRGV